MATPTILGLDIGGANLKAATPDRRAASVPFALWKQPDRLPAALAELVARFPDAEELAVTMTGELCDCFATKRDGVNAILTAVLNVSRSRPVRVWSTDGVFLDTEEARRNHLKVASANWHALATLAGQYVPKGRAILIDIGSTTTDIIPIVDGLPVSVGKTDLERLQSSELVYTGVRRTPVCAILGSTVAAELFATAHDAYLLLGKIAPDPTDCDTADGRPATIACAHARMSRMVGGDPELVSLERAASLADDVMQRQLNWIEYGLRYAAGHLDRVTRKERDRKKLKLLASGSGEFLVPELVKRGLVLEREQMTVEDVRSLTDRLGPEVSACAPAYAVAVLRAERRP